MTDSPTKRISRRRFQAKAISYSQPAPDTTRHPPKEKPPPPAHPTDHLTSSTGTSKTKPLPPHKRESRIGANRSSNVTSDCTIPVFGPFLSPQAVTIVRCTVRFVPVTATKMHYSWKECIYFVWHPFSFFFLCEYNLPRSTSWANESQRHPLENFTD